MMLHLLIKCAAETYSKQHIHGRMHQRGRVRSGPLPSEGRRHQSRKTKSPHHARMCAFTPTIPRFKRPCQLATVRP